MNRERLDVELVRRGLARSRGHARELLDRGVVRVDGRPADKAAGSVDDTTAIVVADDRPAWVGRAAYKLLAALDTFGPLGLTVQGRRCLDVGASTGGFTQVLLAQGAWHVVALDVGHGQLAEPVRSDPRVTDRPGTSIRDVRPDDLGGSFDLVVADLSFISLTLVFPRLTALVDPDGDVVVLVKPQFEVGRDRLGKGGIVRSAKARTDAVRRVLDAAGETGLTPRHLVTSPILGGSGNQEYLVWLSPGPRAQQHDVEAIMAAMEQRE